MPPNAMLVSLPSISASARFITVRKKDDKTEEAGDWPLVVLTRGERAEGRTRVAICAPRTLVVVLREKGLSGRQVVEGSAGCSLMRASLGDPRWHSPTALWEKRDDT